MAITDTPSRGSPGSVTFRVAPGVSWAVEMHGLILRGPSGARVVHYPAAAVWDLISRKYPFDKVVTLTGYISDLEEEPARALVNESLRDWVAAGYLEEVAADG